MAEPSEAQSAPEPKFDISPDIEALMNFDPFEKKSEPAPEAAPSPTPAEQGTPSETPAAPPSAAPAAVGETAPPKPPPAEPLANPELTTAVKELTTTLQRQREPASQQPQPQDDIPAYDFQVPDQLQQMLSSEDARDRTQGMALVMKGVARATHQMVVSQMRAEFSRVVPMMVESMQAQRDHSQHVFQDFYTKFPELNRLELRQLVAGVANQVAQEAGAKDWTPALRDRIGERVRGILTSLQPSTPAPVPTTPVATPPSARPIGVKPGPQSQQQEMLDLLQF